MVTIAVLALLPAWRNQLPVGYGGFFVVMAEKLVSNGFALPLEVPFYGPGGTPFAYPPLGIYLMALASGPLGVPAMAYVRWFPGLFSVVLTLAVYALARRLTGNRWVACLATLLVMTNHTVLDYHTTVAGVVRGPALAFAVAGVWAALAVVERVRLSRGWLAAAAAFFALTLLSHLSYAVFLVLSLAVVVVFGGGGLPARRRLAATGIISGGGLLLASPWWLTVVGRWGLAPFTSAALTHGGFGAASGAASYGVRLPYMVAANVVATFEAWSPALVPGLAIAGFGLLLVRRQWLVPVWGLAATFGVGESDRYLALVGGVAAAMLLGELATSVRKERPGLARLTAAVPAVLVAGLCLVSAARDRAWTVAALSPELIETAAWLREQTPQDSRYLELTGDHDAGEWLPFLTRRTPSIAPWGSEWNGRSARQVGLYQTLLQAARSQRPELLERLLGQPDVHPEFVVAPVSSSAVLGYLEAIGFAQLDRNVRYVVLGRRLDRVQDSPEGTT